jgi:hypothetical protein
MDVTMCWYLCGSKTPREEDYVVVSVVSSVAGAGGFKNAKLRSYVCVSRIFDANKRECAVWWGWCLQKRRR